MSVLRRRQRKVVRTVVKSYGIDIVALEQLEVIESLASESSAGPQL